MPTVSSDERSLTPAQQRTAAIEGKLVELAPRILQTLPHGMSIERFQAVTITAIAKNPDLQACEPASVIMSVLEAAALGLEPTGSLSQAWLVPFKEKDAPKPKAQLIIGVRGLEELARRSGAVQNTYSRVVYEGDTFSVKLGTAHDIEHIPAYATTDPTRITHVYAVAQFPNGGGLDFEVMTKEEIDRIRARSRSRNFGPWVTDYAEMARKTVVRRLVKRLPLSVEARDAIERDDEREYGQPAVSVERPISKTAEVKRLLASRNDSVPTPVEAEEKPDLQGPGEVAANVANVDARPVVSAVPSDGTDKPAAVPQKASATRLCGQLSPFGGGVLCDQPTGHTGVHKAGADETWPQ